MSGKKKHRPVRACLIVSARSGEGTLDLAAAQDVLTRQGWDVAVRQKQEKGDAVRLARQAAEDGYDPIVNCGGDGTLNEIIDGVVGMPVSVGTIPGGTENVWSKEVGISSRSEVAATQLVSGIGVKVDIGSVEAGGKPLGHFLMMAGLGVDGAVMSRVSRSVKRRLGPFAVGMGALEAAPSLRGEPVKASFDGVRWEGEAAEIIVGNTRLYGGFTRITGGAYVDDGLLDICLFTTDGWLQTGQQLASLVLRKRPSSASAELYRAADITLRVPSSMPLQLDGSAQKRASDRSHVEYRFTVLPHAVRMIVPNTYDGALFRDGMEYARGRKKDKKKP